MLQNEYLVAKIGVDTTENEPSEVSPKWGVPSGSFRGHRKHFAAIVEVLTSPATCTKVLVPAKSATVPEVPVEELEPAVMKLQAKAKGDSGRKRAAEIKQTQDAALAEAKAALESGDVDRLAMAVKTGHGVGLGKKDADFVAACDKLASLRPGAPELSVPAPAALGASPGVTNGNGGAINGAITGAANGTTNGTANGKMNGAGADPPLTSSMPVSEMDSKTAQVAAVLMRCSEALDKGDADTAYAAFAEFNEMRTASWRGWPSIEKDLANHGWGEAVIQDLETRVNEQKSEQHVEEICAGPFPLANCCSMRDKSAP
jgi:hypothetical protein